MDNFIVSARKYRPATFDMVVGQNSITNTLKNAIRNNYLAHAYLFCGPRGVGKTTCARIYAKTINCQNITETVEPCNSCESCVSFNELRSLNIHELDAASNNKVEDIRTLTDQVRIPPQTGRYKIYIIDEVHMLSSSAFNAFLKTLEEPPPHALFILATTEKHKIIPTILSRCQIFDFNRIRTADIAGRLEFVAKKESVEYDDDALHTIAVKADGAMRDALSIFDQIVSYSSGRVTYEDVIKNLNLLDHEYYFRMVDSALKGSYAEALLIYDEILENGFDGHNFISGFGSHIRNLLMSRDEGTIKLIETAESVRVRYREQAHRCSETFLFKAMDICSSCDVAYKSSKNQRLLVEISLCKLASLAVAGAEQGEEKKKKDKLPPVKGDERLTVVREPSSNKDDAGQTPAGQQYVKATPAEKEREEKESREEGVDLHAGKQARHSTLSLRSLIGERGDTAENPSMAVSDSNSAEAESCAGEEPGSFEEMEVAVAAAWREITGTVEQLSPRIATQIETISPDMSDGNRVLFVLDNLSLKEEFDTTIKPRFIRALSEHLTGTVPEVDTITGEKDDQESTSLYTDQQKFEYIASVNRSVVEMRKVFGLDFD